MKESRDELRSAALSRRRMLAPADWLAWSRSIQASAMELPHYRAAQSIALYHPVQNEVDTRAILHHALASGKRVYYPKLDPKGSADFARVSAETDLVRGRFGIFEPVGIELITPADRDGMTVFVPGVSFDRRGNRLGRGGGWYDRVLGEWGDRGIFIGLAYEFQLVDSLPPESWDQRVHFIVTEKSLIDCGNAPHQSSC